MVEHTVPRSLQRTFRRGKGKGDIVTVFGLQDRFEECKVQSCLRSFDVRSRVCEGAVAAVRVCPAEQARESTTYLL